MPTGVDSGQAANATGLLEDIKVFLWCFITPLVLLRGSRVRQAKYLSNFAIAKDY